MDRKVKYITFHTKERLETYETRTCSPYVYPKCNKCTVSVRKVLCKYKKIITKNCRTNDILKFMDSDLSFPMNGNDYTNLLIKVTQNSNGFLDSLPMLRRSNEISLLKLAFYSIQDNHSIIESLLYNELEKVYPVDIKSKAKLLRFNLIICIRILQKINEIAHDLMTTDIIDKLEIYISHLRTVCYFIYLIILKKKSTVVNKLLQIVSYRNSNIPTCSLCGQAEMACTCFVDLDSASNINFDRGDDFLADKNIEDESVPHCSKDTAYAEIDDATIWHQYLENNGYYNENPKETTQESSTDTD